MAAVAAGGSSVGRHRRSGTEVFYVDAGRGQAAVGAGPGHQGKDAAVDPAGDDFLDEGSSRDTTPSSSSSTFWWGSVFFLVIALQALYRFGPDIWAFVSEVLRRQLSLAVRAVDVGIAVPTTWPGIDVALLAVFFVISTAVLKAKCSPALMKMWLRQWFDERRHLVLTNLPPLPPRATYADEWKALEVWLTFCWTRAARASRGSRSGRGGRGGRGGRSRPSRFPCLPHSEPQRRPPSWRPDVPTADDEGEGDRWWLHFVSEEELRAAFACLPSTDEQRGRIGQPALTGRIIDTEGQLDLRVWEQYLLDCLKIEAKLPYSLYRDFSESFVKTIGGSLTADAMVVPQVVILGILMSTLEGNSVRHMDGDAWHAAGWNLVASVVTVLVGVGSFLGFSNYRMIMHYLVGRCKQSRSPFLRRLGAMSAQLGSLGREPSYSTGAVICTILAVALSPQMAACVTLYISTVALLLFANVGAVPWGFNSRSGKVALQLLYVGVVSLLYAYRPTLEMPVSDDDLSGVCPTEFCAARYVVGETGDGKRSVVAVGLPEFIRLMMANPLPSLLVGMAGVLPAWLVRQCSEKYIRVPHPDAWPAPLRRLLPKSVATLIERHGKQMLAYLGNIVAALWATRMGNWLSCELYSQSSDVTTKLGDNLVFAVYVLIILFAVLVLNRARSLWKFVVTKRAASRVRQVGAGPVEVEWPSSMQQGWHTFNEAWSIGGWDDDDSFLFGNVLPMLARSVGCLGMVASIVTSFRQTQQQHFGVTVAPSLQVVNEDTSARPADDADGFELERLQIGLRRLVRPSWVPKWVRCPEVLYHAVDVVSLDIYGVHSGGDASTSSARIFGGFDGPYRGSIKVNHEATPVQIGCGVEVNMMYARPALRRLLMENDGVVAQVLHWLEDRFGGRVDVSRLASMLSRFSPVYSVDAQYDQDDPDVLLAARAGGDGSPFTGDVVIRVVSDSGAPLLEHSIVKLVNGKISGGGLTEIDTTALLERLLFHEEEQRWFAMKEMTLRSAARLQGDIADSRLVERTSRLLRVLDSARSSGSRAIAHFSGTGFAGVLRATTATRRAGRNASRRAILRSLLNDCFSLAVSVRFLLREERRLARIRQKQLGGDIPPAKASTPRAEAGADAATSDDDGAEAVSVERAVVDDDAEYNRAIDRLDRRFAGSPGASAYRAPEWFADHFVSILIASEAGLRLLDRILANTVGEVRRAEREYARRLGRSFWSSKRATYAAISWLLSVSSPYLTEWAWMQLTRQRGRDALLRAELSWSDTSSADMRAFVCHRVFTDSRDALATVRAVYIWSVTPRVREFPWAARAADELAAERLPFDETLIDVAAFDVGEALLKGQRVRQAAARAAGLLAAVAERDAAADDSVLPVLRSRAEEFASDTLPEEATLEECEAAGRAFYRLVTESAAGAGAGGSADLDKAGAARGVEDLCLEACVEALNASALGLIKPLPQAEGGGFEG